MSWPRSTFTRSLRKVSGLPLYLHAIVFERPLRGMNVNSSASRTYRLLADISRTNSSCAACHCLESYFWVRRILWLLKMTEKLDQRICIKFCFQLRKTSSETIQMMQMAFLDESMGITQRTEWCRWFKNGTSKSEQCKVNVNWFFDYEVVMHHEYAPTSRTINKEYYVQILKRLREAVRKKRPHFWSSDDWLLHLDNAPAHSSNLLQ